MLEAKNLLSLTSMPHWHEISLKLYKEFSEKYLIPTIFRYYLENGKIINVKFTEWSIYHMLAIQHIDGKISNEDFFNKISNGLDFDYFSKNPKLRKRFYDFKHRIKLFACTYQIMKNQNIFYSKKGMINATLIQTDYVKYALINGKGTSIGIKYINGDYVAFSILVDRSKNPTKSIDGLEKINILKLEIVRGNVIIEKIEYC